MDNDSPASLDLSLDEAWLGLRPGMTRSEVMALATKAGVLIDTWDKDPTWALLEGDWGMELRFEKNAPNELRQISRDDDELTWRGEPLMGAPLHEALAAMQIDPAETAWHPEDATNDAMDGSPPSKPGPYSDEFLLYEGTVWVPKRGLGLVMLEGCVCELVWRRPQDLPVKFEGPVTPAQLAWSRRDDLAQSLRKALKTEPDSFVTSKTWTPLQWLLFLVFACSMGLLVKSGIAEAQLWQQALVITGHLTALEPLAGKPGEQAYHITYADPAGYKQSIVLERADFYVAPREIGDEAQVNYVPGEPPRVKGLPRARDVGFLTYVPRGLTLMGGYIVANIIAGWLGQRSRSKAGSTPLPRPGSKPPQGPGNSPPGMPQVKRL